MKRRHRLSDLVLVGLLGLYLVAVTVFVRGPRVESWSEALRWQDAPGTIPVGPVGQVVGQVTLWALGPWLRWVVPALPLAWMLAWWRPPRQARRWRPWWQGTVVLLALAAVLAHPAWVRLEVPPASGGALGAWIEGGARSLVGPLGSFLLLMSTLAFLLLRWLPPIYVRFPALDAALERLGSTFGRGGALVRRLGMPLRGLGRVLAQRARSAGGWARDRASLFRRSPRELRMEFEATDPGALEAGSFRGQAATDARLDDRQSPSDWTRAGRDGTLDGARRPRERLSAPGGSHAEAEGLDVQPAFVGAEAGAGGTAAQAGAASGAGMAGEASARPASRGVVAGRGEPGRAADGDASLERRSVAAGEDGAGSGEDGAVDEFRLSRDPSELLQEESPRRRRRRGHGGDYPLPSLDLLDDVPKEERGFSRDVLQMKARLLMETLSHYAIEGRINEIRPGPVVTTFEFEPAPGVKVSQITSRADDLALAMRATRIRIEAPIPGKAAVGIEIPNPYPQVVSLKEVIAAIPDDRGVSPLTLAMGKNTEGEPHLADIPEMPHLLVAGATGSGKSVCINSIICNLLLRNGPDKLRLLMVDPKMLELSVYNGIPHLLHPVITEAKEALKAVKWAVAEMSVRYTKLAQHAVRNIGDYNAKVEAGQVRDAEGQRVRETMPYFVIIIDELADLMMQLGQDLETPIARLAQMARAVGIHLVLATQRPSVNVITGVIKANFPSRVAFRVMSKVDSRTILDCMGAEALLGKGDMLFLLAGMPQPVRVHGAYLDIEECERIVEHWQKYTEEDAELDLDGPELGGGVDLGDDELLDEAKRLVVMTQSGSVSMLQRRLRVGYTRAARLMDMLEAAGVVGGFEGSKAREVLVSREELEGEG